MARNDNSWMQLLDLPLKAAQLSSEQEFRNWQAKQGAMENEIALAKANLVPNPQGDIVVGGQRYSRRPPMMPDLSSLGIGNSSGGMGFTGGTYNPMSGELSLNIGQTPEAKMRQETESRANKALQEEESKYQSGKALIGQIREKWLKTNPTKVTNNGNFSLLGAGKAVVSPLYGVEQWVGSRLGVTPNQRSDKAYIKFVNSLRSRLAKGTIGTDIGNLSEYEQRVVTEGVPSAIWDSYEQGEEILNNLNDVMLEMKKARTEGFKDLGEKRKKEGRVLDKDTAIKYLQQAKGDKERAKTLALRDGWFF